MTRTWLTVLFWTTLAGGTASIHHSFAAEYFEDQMVSITGDVAEFDVRNPHSWLYVMVADEESTPRRFAAEWAGVGRLARDGVTKDTLKPGDRVVISGSPGRTASERRIHLKAIHRPADGWKWSRVR